MSKLKWFNVALRALMELGIVVALGYWGFMTGSSTGEKILLGISAPVILFGFWSLVNFHQAGKLSELLRLFQELVISLLAAVAAYLAGAQVLGWALALISIVYHVLVYVLGGTLLKH